MFLDFSRPVPDPVFQVYPSAYQYSIKMTFSPILSENFTVFKNSVIAFGIPRKDLSRSFSIRTQEPDLTEADARYPVGLAHQNRSGD
jgi:hypothetical protein